MGYAEQYDQQYEYSLQQNLGGFLAYQNGYGLATDEPVALDVQDIGYGGADEDNAEGKEKSDKHAGGNGKTDFELRQHCHHSCPGHGHENILGTRQVFKALETQVPRQYFRIIKHAKYG